MTSIAGHPGAPLAARESPSDTASAGRRFAAAALDAALLGVGLAFVLGTELALAPEDEWTLFLYGWLLVFAPLYFALYHAYGTGATPGQLELRIGLRDATGGERPTLARSLARAYLGLLFLVLVLPALADVLAMASGRSLRDRITRTAAVGITLSGKAPELAAPTVPELAAVFEPPPGTRRYLSRGWTLLRARPRLVVGPVAAVYAVLATVAAVLGFLLVADSGDPWAILFFAELVVLLLASGVYWSLAVLVVAVEEIRVGARVSVWRTLTIASRRANALSVALVGILFLAAASAYTFFLASILLGRLTLVAPALVLEDTRVLGAFRRSWQLTRGQTWRLFGLLLLSGALLAATVGVTLALIAPAVESAGAAVVVLVLLAIAFVVVLAWVGAAWSLVYEDSRRRRASEEGR
jgi:hypothetical protein